MPSKKTITEAGLLRAKVAPQLVTTLSEQIEELAERTLPEPWPRLLVDYGLLIRAEYGARLYPADFGQYTQRFIEALYDAGEAEAADAAEKSATTPSPKKKGK